MKINKTPVIITVLPFLAMLVTILPYVFYHNNGIDTVRAGIITLLLTGAVSFYIRVNADSILSIKYASSIISLGYLVSICLLVFLPSSDIFCFWMLGGLLVSTLLDIKLGLLIHFNLSFFMSVVVNNHTEQIIKVLIIGVLMSLVAGALRQKNTVIYAIIIILSSNITISFALNNLVFNRENNFEYLKSLISLFIVLITNFIISAVFYRVNKVMIREKDFLEHEITDAEGNKEKSIAPIKFTDNSMKTDEIAVTLSVQTDEEKYIEHNMTQDVTQDILLEDININSVIKTTDIVSSDGTSYDVLCDFSNELLVRMKEYSESLYQHSLRIGDLSCRAARLIGADEKVALAGGLYHEIGKIKSKNYVEEGLVIAEEYSFPKELKAILKEHNINFDKPNSVEAAIVMLSDGIVSTIEYIEKNVEHKITMNKVVSSIFQLRMDKGSFDSSNLTLKDFKLLKEFYHKEFEKQ